MSITIGLANGAMLPVIARGPGDFVEGLLPLIVVVIIVASIVSSIRKAAKGQERAAALKLRRRARGDDDGWENVTPPRAVQPPVRVQPAKRQAARQVFGQLPWGPNWQDGGTGAPSSGAESHFERDENVFDDHAPSAPVAPKAPAIGLIRHDRRVDSGSAAGGGDAEDDLILGADLMPRIDNHRDIARSFVFAEILQRPVALRGRGRAGAVR